MYVMLVMMSVRIMADHVCGWLLYSCVKYILLYVRELCPYTSATKMIVRLQ